MKKLSFSGVEDYLALIARRKWWALAPFLLLTVMVILVARLLPDIYVSETLILVEPELPSDFVKDLVNVSIEKRLREIQETVLSRTNLLRIINEFETGLKNYRGLDAERRVTALRNDINIEFETERGLDSPVLGFRISYQNQDPQLAQRITSRLASLFIEYDNRNRVQLVSGTTEFLNSELDKVSKELEQEDQAVKDVKARYRYELPDQTETTLRTLDRLQTQMQTNTEALDRFVSLRLSLERQLSETLPTIVEQVADRGSSGKDASSALAAEYRAKERAYRELTSKYKEEHPDVQRLKAELDRLRREIPPGDLTDKPESTISKTVTKPNPLYQNLATQLREVKTEIGIRERERNWIQAEIGKNTQRLQNAPEREQELASVLRGYDESKKQYEDLKSKLTQAKLAGSLQTKTKGTHFTILDPANLPFQPSKPHRPRIILLGLCLSLALGLATALCVEVVDQKLWTQQEVEKLLGVPVLVEIPEILSEQELQDEKKTKIVRIVTPVIIIIISISLLYLLCTAPKMKALVGVYFGKLSNL